MACEARLAQLSADLEAEMYAVVLAHVLTLLPYISLLRTLPYRRDVPWSERVYSYLHTSVLGNAILVAHSIISLFAAVFFIVETYLGPDDECRGAVVPPWSVCAGLPTSPPPLQPHHLSLRSIHLLSKSHQLSLNVDDPL